MTNTLQQQFTIEPVEADSIPERPTPKYRGILEQFLDSGQEASRITLEGATTTNLVTGLRMAVKTTGASVSVFVRHGEVFLVRN